MVSNTLISKSLKNSNLLMTTLFRIPLLLLGMATFTGSALQAQRAIFVEETHASTDFNLVNSELPSWDIVPGGPGKDGIPALTTPTFAVGKKDKWLQDEDLVVGVHLNGVAKAYPVRILNYHEVVNDNFKDQAVAITYSPLCGSAMAYRTSDGKNQWELAVSGLLYNNNALYFDRQTESLWSQALGRAVAGPVAGAQLELLPTTLTTWGEWQTRHPETLVLSRETGFSRNYGLDTYAHYATTDRLMFPLNGSDKRLTLKERVLGVNIDGATKAYPYSVLRSAENHITTDVVNGQDIRITYIPSANAAYVTDANGLALPHASMYWFAWAAFNPETEVFKAPTDAPTSLSMMMGAL